MLTSVLTYRNTLSMLQKIVRWIPLGQVAMLIVPRVWHHRSHDWQLEPFTLTKSFSTEAVRTTPFPCTNQISSYDLTDGEASQEMTCVCNIICSQAFSHPEWSTQCCSLHFLFSLSYFFFFWILFPHFPSLRPSLALFSPSFCMVHSFLLHSSSHNFNVMALLQHPSLILLFSPSPSFPLSLSLSFSPCGAEKNTAFPLTKTLLLSGNYRRRLITTLGSNDAAPNEIFIKDPSASN